MNIEYINDIMELNTIKYDNSLSEIKSCIAAYEKHCRKLIKNLKKLSFEESQNIFDELFLIQGYISNIWFIRKIDINESMKVFVREFERLHDPFIRKFWFEKFKNGEEWPS